MTSLTVHLFLLRNGIAVLEMSDEAKDMQPLFETIINHIPAPTGDPDKGTQVLISTIDYNEYVGRIGVGKVSNGTIRVNQDAVIVNAHDPEKNRKVKISKLYEFDGLNKIEVEKSDCRLNCCHLRYFRYSHRRYLMCP